MDERSGSGQPVMRSRSGTLRCRRRRGRIRAASAGRVRAGRVPVKDASQFYPTDWLEASNSRNQLLGHYVKKRDHYQDTYYHQVKAQAPVVVTTVHPDPEAAMAPSPEYDWEPTGQTSFGSYRDNDTGQYSYGEYAEYQSVDREVIYPGRGFRAKKDGTPRGKDW